MNRQEAKAAADQAVQNYNDSVTNNANRVLESILKAIANHAKKGFYVIDFSVGDLMFQLKIEESSNFKSAITKKVKSLLVEEYKYTVSESGSSLTIDWN